MADTEAEKCLMIKRDMLGLLEGIVSGFVIGTFVATVVMAFILT